MAKKKSKHSTAERIETGYDDEDVATEDEAVPSSWVDIAIAKVDAERTKQWLREFIQVLERLGIPSLVGLLQHKVAGRSVNMLRNKHYRQFAAKEFTVEQCLMSPEPEYGETEVLRYITNGMSAADAQELLDVVRS